jgi:hypothetical protein
VICCTFACGFELLVVLGVCAAAGRGRVAGSWYVGWALYGAGLETGALVSK